MMRIKKNDFLKQNILEESQITDCHSLEVMPKKSIEKSIVA